MTRTMFRFAPDVSLRISAIRSRRLIEKQVRELGFASLARKIASVTGDRVARGPLAGMILNYDLLPVHTAPKFLGLMRGNSMASLNEDELRDAVDERRDNNSWLYLEAKRR